MAAEWVLSVAQLNEYVRKQLAGDPILSALRIRGELSGFKRHYSGHLYFTLKDQQARVQCVMFRQYAQALNFDPQDGMQVLVRGSASLFVRDGSYQVYCEEMRREGVGDLYVRFEELKAKLMAEGLFDVSLKKPLPMLPKRIGIITSSSGAAFHDMVRVIRRRYPGMGILLVPSAVQGEGAGQELADALDRLNLHGTVDVVLMGRGGGSIEDLWAFNEEVVARAIARSRIPVISCVGHEVDFTIADFVADVRAATPSVAAELAVPIKAELASLLDILLRRAARAQSAQLERVRARLDRLGASSAFSTPGRLLIEGRRDALSALGARVRAAMNARIVEERHRLGMMDKALSGLNPRAVIERGYAVVTKGGLLTTRADQLVSGDTVDIHMHGGTARAVVEEIIE